MVSICKGRHIVRLSLHLVMHANGMLSNCIQDDALRLDLCLFARCEETIECHASSLFEVQNKSSRACPKVSWDRLDWFIYATKLAKRLLPVCIVHRMSRMHRSFAPKNTLPPAQTTTILLSEICYVKTRSKWVPYTKSFLLNALSGGGYTKHHLDCTPTRILFIYTSKSKCHHSR